MNTIASTKRKLPFCALLVAILLAAANASAGVDRVLCVPWEGNPAKFHTAISGQSVQLTAVIYGDATGGTYAYSWDFYDGSAPLTGSIYVPANGRANLAVSHTFTGSAGATYPTALTIAGITDIYNVILAPDTNDSRINIAIDKGLWYLHQQMIVTTAGSPPVPAGYWNDSGYYVGRSGAPVWAFEVQGHRLPVEADPLTPLEDPYVENVQRGINYILSRTYYQPMGVQTHGHPEDYDNNGTADGNGWGLYAFLDSGHTNYEQGLAMGAISGSGAPNAVAATGQGTYVLGRTYHDIVQDMADWYAWSQVDGNGVPPTYGAGGWYYYAYNSTTSGTYLGTYGDNSASQWAYIGLDAAEANFGVSIAPWMKGTLAQYLHNQIVYRGGNVSYRASDSSDPSNDNVCLTGGALVGMALVGQSIYDAANGAGAYAADMTAIEMFMGQNWRGTTYRFTENWYGHRAYYTMYAVMKGFRLQGITSLPGSPGTTDWYNDYVSVMLPDQYADGHFRGTGWMDGYIVDDMGTAFAVLILTPSVFSPPPVACFTADPNPAYLDIPISMDPACTYHSDPEKNIVLYEWDFDNDGTYEVSSVTPDIQIHTWPSATYGLGTYPVTLRVTDDTAPTPVTDTYILPIDLTTPPHPPVADAGGPYLVSMCSGDSLTLDGSGSYDIDEGDSESGSEPFDTITQYEWDLDGAPWTYPVNTGTSAALVINDLSGFSAGDQSIGLKVTDNTALAFPGSMQPNLTDEGFAVATVYEGCICNLAARAKLNKIQLTWANTGAVSYDIYRSTVGPNGPFALIASDVVTTYATYLDEGLTIGTTYYYRVVTSDGCGSNGASATPAARTR